MSITPETLPALRSRITELLSKLRELTEPMGPGGRLLAAMAEAEVGGDLAMLVDRAQDLADVVQNLDTQLREFTENLERLPQVGEAHGSPGG